MGMQRNRLFFQDDVILKLMRDRFVMDFIFNIENRNHSLKENLSYLNLNPCFTFPTMALIELAGSFKEEHEKRKYTEGMRDYLQQYVADGSLIFMDEEGRIGLLFSWVSTHLIEAIQLTLNRHFVNPVNIGVGKPCSQLSDVHTSYHQALSALQDKFYKGIGKIVYYNELGKYAQLRDYPIAKEKELFEHIKYAECSTDIEKAVDYFYEHILQSGLIDRKYIYELTIRLLVSMEKNVLADSDKVSTYKRYEIMSILKLETFQEIKNYVSAYFKGLREIIVHNENESHRSIIKKTIQYMEQECQCATLYSVAQKVYLTPTYLSLLFKMNTGKTFIEQLTDIRMDKAKDMLKSTHLKNYEVAEKVGYQDSRYFSQIFKKKVGVSPSKYRESIGN
jgi:two-component system response regulator YesN